MNLRVIVADLGPGVIYMLHERPGSRTLYRNSSPVLADALSEARCTRIASAAARAEAVEQHRAAKAVRDRAADLRRQAARLTLRPV